MRFDEALKEIFDNEQAISRESWSIGYLEYNKLNKEILFFDGHGSQRWCPSHQDIVATDWEIIDS